MSQWIVCPQPRSHPQLRLFCFAYAGGSAWVFRSWAEQLPVTLEVCAIELPGRGKRLSEPALTDIATLVRDLGPQLLPYLDRPFACFGHSLGALIAFELCQWLRRAVQLTPTHFWASAACAPHLLADRVPIHDLSEADFIAALRRYNGTPTSVLNNAELMALMLPTLRADFTLLETYQYQPRAPLTCPIMGLWGQQDPIVIQAEVDAWQVHTHQFSIEAIAGDHFFIQQPQFPQRLLPRLAEWIG
ncbi:MAG: alpha/beta fold hydrolase [Cyanobacteria bacterium P01_F01_bin.4]